MTYTIGIFVTHRPWAFFNFTLTKNPSTSRSRRAAAGRYIYIYVEEKGVSLQKKFFQLPNYLSTLCVEPYNSIGNIYISFLMRAIDDLDLSFHRSCCYQKKKSLNYESGTHNIVHGSKARSTRAKRALVASTHKKSAKSSSWSANFTEVSSTLK